MAAQDALMQNMIDAINNQTRDLLYATLGPLGLGPSYNPTVRTVSISITRPADTNAYTALDAFADSTSAARAGGFMLLNMARAPGGSGTITDAEFSTSASTAIQGELWIFDQPVTATVDNAALSVSDSDILNLVGVIPFNCIDVNAANAISYVTNIGVGFTCVGASSNLYCLVKVSNAPTPASAEVLSIRLKVVN